MLRIAYDVVKPILSFHVYTEAEKYFQPPWAEPSPIDGLVQERCNSSA